MFAVVRNKDHGYYVVCLKWIEYIADDAYAHFPPPSKMKRYLESQADSKDKWGMECVEIISNFDDLQSADEYLKEKCKFQNTDESELEKRNPPKKRKIKSTKLYLSENDFNLSFDSESSVAPIQAEKPKENAQVVIDDVLIDENTNIPIYVHAIPSTSYSSGMQQLIAGTPTSFNNSSQQPITEISSMCSFPTTTNHEMNQSSVSANQTEMVLVPRNVLNSILSEMKDIKNTLDNFISITRDEFKSLNKKMITSGNDIDLEFKPKTISNLAELKEMEEKLNEMNSSFLDEYNKIINYFSATISPPNKQFGVQAGNMHSLMSMYLDKSFAKNLGYSSTKTQEGFDKFTNHKRFFFIICNKKESNMFKNLTEVEIAVQKFFKSVRANPRAKKNNENIEKENFEQV